MIFVFGSNEAGRHGKGAAKTAYEKYGARYGMSYGHYGKSFAIPTKDATLKKVLSINQITAYVNGFLAYAESHPQLLFKITRIGCGLSGVPDFIMAKLFWNAPKNCYFDTKWQPFLPKDSNFWGTW